jgi:hypothetical protein
MIDTSVSPPKRLASPAGKWFSPPDSRTVNEAVRAATHDKSRPISFACGVVRFSVASDGTVQNVTVLAEYPTGIGFGDALAKSMATLVYPPTVAGGPYALKYAVHAQRRLLRSPPAS